MLAAAALGRALTCTLLVADGLKDEETFQVTFNGDGPLRGVMATANGKLESRGYVGNPAVTLPPTGAGKLDVGGGVHRRTHGSTGLRTAGLGSTPTNRALAFITLDCSPRQPKMCREHPRSDPS